MRRRQARVAARATFDRIRTPLRTWSGAASRQTTGKGCMTVVALTAGFGVSYQVTRPTVHRYRVAMV
ncbi:MAG: hypothetical protein ACYCR4_09215 [Acidimicrobiales bacterium]